MYCSRCGKEATGKYCWNCGSPLPQKKGKIIEFVPKDETTELDQDPSIWEDSDDSMDKTVVLEPVDSLSSDRKRRAGYEENQDVSEDMEEAADAQETEKTAGGGSEGGEDEYTQTNPFESGSGEKKGIRTLFKIRTPEEADSDYAKFGKDPYGRADHPEEDEYVEEGETEAEEETEEKPRHRRKKKPVTREEMEKIRQKRMYSLMGIFFSVAGFLLLGAVTMLLAKEFYNARYGLGNPVELLDEGNLSICFYFILVGIFVFTETMFTFRNLSRKRAYVHKKLIKYDSGKGLTGFVILIVLGIISKKAVNSIPTTFETMRGAVLFFQVILDYQFRLIMYGILGCICCGIRIFNGRR